MSCTLTPHSCRSPPASSISVWPASPRSAVMPRPDHALRAAEQHIKYDRDRQRDREVLCLDVAEMMRIEPSPDAGNNRAEREGSNLECAHVEAHKVGDALVIMDRGDRDAKASREQ